MWYLTSESDKRVIYVLPDKNIIIGRSLDAQNCNFAVPDDASISRKHAILLISENALILNDLGSKYGTYINNAEKMEQNSKIKLKCNDIVKFGKLNCVWRVQEIKFVTCSSTLKGENLQNLKNLLNQLGGNLRSDWDNDCAYLTMPAITLTIKVVLALVQNSHIVSVKYWNSCVEAVTNNNPLPNPNDFTPHIVESTLNKENISFLPNTERNSIFAGKQVVFFSRKQMEMYKTVLIKSSATALLLSDTKLTKTALCDDNVIVIQYNFTSTSQETQTARDQMNDITNYLKSKGKRIVADAEIGLAILFCSTNKYCNPNFNFSSEVIKQVSNHNIPQNVLAQDTQEPSQDKLKNENVVIDESLTPKHDFQSFTNDHSTTALKRKLHDDENNSTYSNVNKKIAKEFPLTTSGNTHKRPGDDTNEIMPNKKMALEDNDDMFNFLKPAAAKEFNESKQSSKLNLSKPSKRKYSTDMDEDNLFNFVDKGNKKPAIELTQNNVLESLHVDDVESEHPINKIKTVNKEKVDLSSLRGSKLEELKKINAEIPYNVNIKKEDISDLDSKFSNIDLGSTVVVVKKDLIIKKEPLEIVSLHGEVKNFKRFKKVWPIKMQITIVQKSPITSNSDSNAEDHSTVNA